MVDFIKLSGNTKVHLMALKVTKMWTQVRVDYITTNNASEMVKLGRLLHMGKTADLDGPALLALGKKTNGCVDHRLDKLHDSLRSIQSVLISWKSCALSQPRCT